MNNLQLLLDLLDGKTIHSSRTEYYCAYADEKVVIFAPTPDTKKIMVPTELAVEWVQAYQFGLINLTMTAREMRQIVQDHSVWAAYQHGFETQMYAIVKTWAEAHPQ
jgi:hypothetical protein